jgi:hypothetical protein
VTVVWDAAKDAAKSAAQEVSDFFSSLGDQIHNSVFGKKDPHSQ